jgi:hypothetical protein
MVFMNFPIFIITLSRRESVDPILQIVYWLEYDQATILKYLIFTID